MEGTTNSLVDSVLPQITGLGDELLVAGAAVLAIAIGVFAFKFGSKWVINYFKGMSK